MKDVVFIKNVDFKHGECMKRNSFCFEDIKLGKLPDGSDVLYIKVSEDKYFISFFNSKNYSESNIEDALFNLVDSIKDYFSEMKTKIKYGN